MDEKIKDKLHREIKSFEKLWEGGYCEGEPLSPISPSTFGSVSFMSVLHATYLCCIKPFINKDTVALEIGPGRGTWTKCMLPAKEIVVMDALSPEHNKFFEYLNNPTNVTYHQVENFDCDFLKEDYFDYMFSFGCLCHVSFNGISEYAKNILPKLKKGAHCFWMIADYKKTNHVAENIEKYSVIRTLDPKFHPPDENDEPRAGRWFEYGIEKTCDMLQNLGYKIHDPDVGTCLRDPIIHFGV